MFNSKQIQIVQNLPMGSFKITGLSPGTAGTDAVNLNQLNAAANGGYENSNYKIYDLYTEFGLTHIDGSKTLTELGIAGSSPTYAKAKAAWDGHYVPYFRQYGADITTNDFTSLDWGCVCHMEALWRGHPLGISMAQTVVSYNTIIWPRGKFRLKFPIFIGQGGMEGKGPGGVYNDTLVNNVTEFQVNHEQWMGGPSEYSKSVEDRTPIRTPSYGQPFSIFGYLELAKISNFSVNGQSARWKDKSFYMSGIGWWRAGEVSTIDRVYSRRCNDHGILVYEAGPSVVREVSVFDNNGAGICVDSSNSLGNLHCEQISGDDNGMGNLYLKNGCAVSFGTIKHETGLSTQRSRERKNNPVIIADGWVNIIGQSITSAVDGLYLPIAIYTKHGAGIRSKIKIENFSGWNFGNLIADLTERILHTGNGNNSTYSGTFAGASATHPIIDGSFVVYDSTEKTSAIGNGSSLTLAINIEATPVIPIDIGSIYMKDSAGNVVARVKSEGGATGTFFDPNYNAIGGAPAGATGYINTQTGQGSITFTSNAPAVGSLIYYRHVNNYIAYEDGNGGLTGLAGTTGNINKITGVYSITLPYNLPSGMQVRCSSNRKYGPAYPYSVIEIEWKNDFAYNNVIAQGDWITPTPIAFFGATARLGIGTSSGDFDTDAGTPLFDITGGLQKAWYAKGVSADEQEAVSYTANSLILNDIYFTNVGTGDIWLADSIRIDATGAVYCNGIAATVTRNIGGNNSNGVIANNTFYNYIKIVPSAPFAITEMFGKTGNTSVRFTNQVWASDTTIEIY